jgi:pimeloyl-ACP methyl ester carboxylesterase
MRLAASRVTAMVAVVVLAAGACGSGAQRSSPTSSATTPAARAPAATYAKAPCPNPIYTGEPQLDLGPDVECGYLTVPQNRGDPNSRKIRLAVAVRKSKAQNPKPDPVVYLAGGPGNSPFVHRFDNWQLDRDLILLGQRGTMKGDPFLSCSEIDRFLSEAIDIGAQDAIYSEKSAAALHACRQRVAADVIDVAPFNTTESASDVADLRVAMGIDNWNIYALSYGVDLAFQTLRDHPEGIRSVVLDSVLPPQANVIESGWAAAAQSFNAIFDGCKADPACAAKYPDVRAEFTRMVNQLSGNPLRVTLHGGAAHGTDVVIDGYTLASGVVVAAAQTPGQLARIPAMIHKLATGDPTDVATALTEITPPNIVSYGLMYSVLCSEMVSRTSVEKVYAAGKLALPDFPDGVLAMPAQVPSIFTDCQQWKVPAAAVSVAEPVHSDVPVLLASGSFDSATPPSLAADAAKTLPNSRVLVFPGSGHEVALNTPDAAACFLEVMRSFYDDPSRYTTDCVAALRIPPFATA